MHFEQLREQFEQLKGQIKDPPPPLSFVEQVISRNDVADKLREQRQPMCRKIVRGLRTIKRTSDVLFSCHCPASRGSTVTVIEADGSSNERGASD